MKYKVKYPCRIDNNIDHVLYDYELLDAATDALVTRYPSAHTETSVVRFANSGKFFISGSRDYTLKLFLIDPTQKEGHAESTLDLHERFMTFCLNKEENLIIGRHYYDDSFAIYKIDENYKLVPLDRWKIKNLNLYGLDNCRLRKNRKSNRDGYDVIFYDKNAKEEGFVVMRFKGSEDGDPVFYKGLNYSQKKRQMHKISPKNLCHKWSHTFRVL